jgi:DNA invertase Pin-like site-specific DNA recombinase
MPAADRKRYAAYMRVSRVMGREGASYMSPDQQREAIERWAGYRDADVEIADEDWILEEDRSGGTQDRPKLQAIIERIERHELDGLICAKLNRFARSVISAKLDVERILAAEGSIGFVAEDIDPTTRNGRFVLTMFLAIAELELDGIKDGWAEVKLRVAERGVKLGPCPVGYRRVVGDADRKGCIAPDDPGTAPHITRAFKLAAADGAVDAALAYLLAESVPGRWNTSTVRRMLANRTYLGEIAGNPDACKPLTDARTFLLAQHDPAPRRASVDFPLSGFACCAGCGGPMIGGHGGRGSKLRTYRCGASRPGEAHKNGATCSAPTSTVADRLEEYARSHLLAELDGLRLAHTVGDRDDSAADADRALAEAEAELEAYVQLTPARLPGYARGLARREESAEEASEVYREAARRAVGAFTVPTAEVVASADGGELGELLRGAYSGIVVSRGRGDIADRVSFLND